MSINKAIISGNLTRDSEERTTSGGTCVLSFGVAVNDRRKNAQTGEWEDYPNYIDCTMFGNRAQALKQYLSKGTKVCIEGKLRYSSWEGDDGQRRKKLEIIVEEIEFMSRSNGGNQQSQPVQQARRTQAYVLHPDPQPQSAAAFAQQAVADIPASQYQTVQPQVYDEDVDW